MLHRFFVVLFIAMYTQTLSAQNLSQAELNNAAEQQLQATEFMLTKAYQQLAEVLVGERLTLLEKAQGEWLAYREASLELIGSQYAGGSIAPLIRAQNAVRMNQSRIAELTAMHLMETTP